MRPHGKQLSTAEVEALIAYIRRIKAK